MFFPLLFKWNLHIFVLNSYQIHIFSSLLINKMILKQEAVVLYTLCCKMPLCLLNVFSKSYKHPKKTCTEEISVQMPPSLKTFCTAFVLSALLSASNVPMGIEAWWMNLVKISTEDKTDLLKTEAFNGCVEYQGRMCIKQWSWEQMTSLRKDAAKRVRV